MSRSLIVPDVPEELVQQLVRRAARHGRTAEAEHREILRQALAAEPATWFLDVAAELRASTKGRRHTPSEVLLREGRDER